MSIQRLGKSGILAYFRPKVDNFGHIFEVKRHRTSDALTREAQMRIYLF